MKKISKFLFCENELLPADQRGAYILHTRKPRFLIEITNVNMDDLPFTQDQNSVLITYVNTDSILELIKLEVIDNIDENNDLIPILKRAADWYIAYLKWQDEQIDGISGSLLKDYNANIPGLKVIYNSESGWLAIYKGAVKRFDNETEMDEWLISQGIPDNFLDEGYVNRVEGLG